MPKTTTFSTKYGYVRHPDDVDGQCFWCGDFAHHWDYTPPRKEVARIESVAETWRRTNPGQKFYAVQCCEQCKNRMYNKRLELLTMTHKKFFWSTRKKESVTVDGMIDIVKRNSMFPWQVRLGDGSVADKPDEMCNSEELQAKRIFYGQPAPDVPEPVKFPDDAPVRIDGKPEESVRGTPPETFIADFD